MQTRVARLYGQKDIRVEMQDLPAPGPGEVLLAMAAGGICGSDLHYYQDGGFGPVRANRSSAGMRRPVMCGRWETASAGLPLASSSPSIPPSLAAIAISA